MTTLATNSKQPQVATGWQASLQISFVLADIYGAPKTQLKDCRHFGPLRVQFPFYPEPDNSICHLYILHPPGGVVGGDEIAIEVAVNEGANALITSPGSSKFYRSAGQTGQVRQVLKVANNATLEWFMQENIFFNGAKTQLTTDIILEEGARFIGWDISCLGRPACDEWFISGAVDSKLGVYRQSLDNPLLIERMRIGADYFVNAMLAQGAFLRSYPMQASFIATHCDNELLAQAEQLLDAHIKTFQPELEWGLTLLDDILILRILGKNTEPMQHMMIALWQMLRPVTLKREAVLPRIWAT